jgi:NAD(P)-dependent dehydrogenase (short-subunit alcohol dehydrogenase family)
MKRSSSSRNKRTLLFLTAGAVGMSLLVRALRPRYELRGKVALVTGGSRGLGYLIATELLRRGAKVAFCARNVDEVLRAEERLRLVSSSVKGFSCDLTKQEDCMRFIDDALRQFGRIDVLVNNAGIIVSGPVDTMTQGDFEEQMKVHFWGPYFLTEGARKEMVQRGAGRIVNISSIGGKIPVPHLLPYVASKFALRGYSEGLRSELKRENIIVTTVCPGLMRTGSQSRAFFKGDPTSEYSWFRGISAIPGLSISAEAAARRIVDALERGDAEVVLGPAAKAADLFYAVAPNSCHRVLSLGAALLPSGTERSRISGREIELPWMLRALTRRLDRAGEEYLEQ